MSVLRTNMIKLLSPVLKAQAYAATDKVYDQDHRCPCLLAV